MKTDEERQKKLCADLRQIYRYIDNDEINELIWQASDEIERLAKQVCELDRQVDHYHGKWGKREND